MKVILLSNDGTREEIEASKDIINCGVIAVGDSSGGLRHYKYRSSSNWVATPLFEEVRCYQHGVEQRMPAAMPATLPWQESDYHDILEDDKHQSTNQMPFQDAVARLLFSSWADVGMRLGPPLYGHLTAIERQCITPFEFAGVAGWVAQRVTVFCIRILLSRPLQKEQKFGWIHAGVTEAHEIDESADAPHLIEKAGRRVLSWPTRALAEHYLEHHMANNGEVCELTVEQLWEACRA